MPIGSLSIADSITTGDLLVLYKNADSSYEAISVSALTTLIQSQLTSQGRYVTQYSAPSATGFSVNLVSDQQDRHLILTPVAGYANGTIVLPLASTCVDGQRVCVNCTQVVTTLAITANGATAVTGAPTTLAANAFFTMAYDQPSNTWYRIS